MSYGHARSGPARNISAGDRHLRTLLRLAAESDLLINEIRVSFKESFHVIDRVFHKVRNHVALSLRKDTLLYTFIKERKLDLGKGVHVYAFLCEIRLAALQTAGLWDWLKTQKGLDTPIETEATNLSGGQRQRIALARALLHDTPLYVFDEATSSIDVESEQDILKGAGKKVKLSIV